MINERSPKKFFYIFRLFLLILYNIFYVNLVKFKNINQYISIDIYTISVNLAGLPGISVPGSLDSKGLPICIQFIGDCFKEKNIIRAAYAFEQSREFTNWSLSGKEEK